jgi:hypothetical protein
MSLPLRVPAVLPAAPRSDRSDRPDPLPTILLRVCPECAGPLVRGSACVTCAHCGWGRCG